MNISTASIAGWYYFYVLGDNKKQIYHISILCSSKFYTQGSEATIHQGFQISSTVCCKSWWMWWFSLGFLVVLVFRVNNKRGNCSPKKRHRYGTFTGKNPRTWSIFMVDVHGFSILMCWVGGESPFFPSNAELFSSWAWSQLFLLDSIWIPSPDFTGFYGDFISRFHQISPVFMAMSKAFISVSRSPKNWRPTQKHISLSRSGF